MPRWDHRHRWLRRRSETIRTTDLVRGGGFHMRSLRAPVSLLGLAFVLVLNVLPASAATTEVGVGDDYFTPVAPTVALGGSVHWSRVSGSDGLHNVAERGGIFRSGGATTGAINFTVKFSAGTFQYWCEVHAPGMAGTIKVRPNVTAAPTGLPFTVEWAASGTNS